MVARAQLYCWLRNFLGFGPKSGHSKVSSFVVYIRVFLVLEHYCRLSCVVFNEKVLLEKWCDSRCLTTHFLWAESGGSRHTLWPTPEVLSGVWYFIVLSCFVFLFCRLHDNRLPSSVSRVISIVLVLMKRGRWVQPSLVGALPYFGG
jgi:hypothetical protein